MWNLVSSDASHLLQWSLQMDLTQYKTLPVGRRLSDTGMGTLGQWAATPRLLRETAHALFVRNLNPVFDQ